MSLVQEMQSHAQDVQRRLRNPINAVRDLDIDLKRKVIPIKNADIPVEVPVTSLDVFGPAIVELDDEAFGPMVLPRGPAKNIWVEDIQRAVCSKYRISKVELLSHRRTAQIVRVRQIAIYLARFLTVRSLPEIGRRFGGMHHTTILHSARKIDLLRGEDAALDGELTDLIKAITA